MELVSRLILVVLVLVGPGRVSAQAAWASAPDRITAGRKLGRILLRQLEQDAIPLRPGPYLLEGLGAEGGPVGQGLAESLALRTFRPAVAGEVPVLRLRLEAQPLQEGGLLVLQALEPALGSWSVHWQEKPWVQEPLRHSGLVRFQGEWAAGPDEAISLARSGARQAAAPHLARHLPWRPWAGTALRNALAEPGLVVDSFLEMESSQAGPLWREWVLMSVGEEREAAVLAQLRRLDRRWFFFGAGAGLAGLIMIALAMRLDWAARGYFTWRIRALCFFLWAGVCAGMVLVL